MADPKHRPPWFVQGPRGSMSAITNATPPGREPYILKSMLSAISANDPNRLLEVIQQGVDINYMFEGDENEMGVFQTTALHICSTKGHVECAKILLENGADTEIAASWGQTALMHSVNIQWHNMIEILIKKGASLDCTDYQGRCSMTYSITNHDLVSLKMLLDAGASTDIGDHYGHSPVHIAARNLDPSFLRMIIEERPDMGVDKVDCAKRTPLHHAVLSGSPESITLLVDLGADLDSLDTNFYTPLTNAICQFSQQPENLSYIGKICQLIESGCQVNKPCPQTGRTALHCLMGRNMPYHELIDYLLSHGADANMKDRNNCTPLHLALMSNNKFLIRKLIRENCSLDARAFDIAVMKGMTDIARFMIEGGATWDRQKYIDKLQTSPYFMREYPEMLSLLDYSLNRVETMAEWARTAIRRSSPPRLPTVIDTYGLPNKLREYIILTEEMADEYYDPF